LITNCEPILSELVSLIDHFNSYNGIHKVIEKSQLFSQSSSSTSYNQNSNLNDPYSMSGFSGGTMGTLADISIEYDCSVLDQLSAADTFQDSNDGLHQSHKIATHKG
jgi:hypothetical protein